MADQHDLIDVREYQRYFDLARSLRLDNNSNVRRMMKVISPARSSKLDLFEFGQLKAAVDNAVKQREQDGFLRAPADILTAGKYTVLYQSDGVPLNIADHELPRGCLFTGMTGAGKTSALINLLLQLLNAGIKVCIFDLKGDLRFIAANPQYQFLIVHPDAPINLLAPLSFLSRAQQIAIITDKYCTALYAAEQQRNAIMAACRAMVSDPHWSFGKLVQRLEDLVKTNSTYSWRDAVRNVIGRLQRLAELYPGLFRCMHGIPLEVLCQHSLYVPGVGDSIDQFIWGVLTAMIWWWKRHTGNRDFTHVFCMDEGILSLQHEDPRRIGPSVMDHATGLVREAGISIIVATNNLSLLSPLVRSNIYLHVAAAAADGKEIEEIARALSLRPQEREFYAKRLPPYHYIARCPRWGEPIVGTLPQPTYDKSVNEEAFQQAIERTNALAPSALEHQTPNVSTASAPSADVEPRLVALNPNAEKLLVNITRSLLPATEHYRQLGLHPQEGHRRKNELLRDGLISQEACIVRSGRGGKGIILVPTQQGYDRAGIRRARGTKGGDSVQHRYCVQQLAAAIPKSTVEAMLGNGKSVDLLVVIDQKMHKRLRKAMPEIALNTADLVAIEVEVSDPLKTAPNNIRKNHDAGIRFTVIAVMPLHLMGTSKALRDLQELRADLYTVLDVFELLQSVDATGVSDGE